MEENNKDISTCKTEETKNSVECTQTDIKVKIEKFEPEEGPQTQSSESSNGPTCATQKTNEKKTAEKKTDEKMDNHAQKRKQPPEEDPVSKKSRASLMYNPSDDDSLSDDEGIYMTILDLPKDFDIITFLEECRAHSMVDLLNNNKRQVQMSFENENDRRKAALKLNNSGIKGNIVYAKMAGADGEFNDNASNTTEIIPGGPWRPSEDAWERDPLGLYGLKLEFLKSLDITPPLDRWVHVTNFRCDKFELRDVMELAGQVLTCSVVNINKRFAKVQYSHPLEAVQAVSMLNDQLYYGVKLKVFMEKNPRNDIILPKGLANIGLGLGLEGRPVRDVVKQYEKYARQETSAINPVLFRKNNLDEVTSNDGQDVVETEDDKMDVNEFMASLKTAAYINKRSFNIRHAEDLQTNRGESNEKDARRTSLSPGSNSIKSLDWNTSNCDTKDSEKSKAAKESSISPTQPEVPGQSVPIRLSSPTNNAVRPFLHPNIPQNPSPRPQGVQPVQSRPTGPQAHFANGMYSSHANQMPSLTPNQMQNMGNQPHPFGPSQPFRPPMPGLVSGPVPIRSAGPVPGTVFRPGPVLAPRPMSGPRPGAVPGTLPVAAPGPIGPTGNKHVVQFVNLPPSTTFPLLCEKLTHCGQVLSLQFTTPGCAIATFGHPSHAERCIQTFNGMTVEGYRIMVTYM